MKELFKPGEEVVCIKDDWEMLDQTPYDIDLPKQNEIYTISSYWHPKETEHVVYMRLKEYPSDYVFNQLGFAPVLPTSTLEKELLEIFQPLTII